MGFLKNLFLGGSRPKQDGGTIRCGDCREAIQPDATRCPHCSAKIFTLRGRLMRRGSIVLALIFIIAGSQAAGIAGIIGVVLGLVFVAIAAYYYLKRPVHSVRPPHRPTRSGDTRS